MSKLKRKKKKDKNNVLCFYETSFDFANLLERSSGLLGSMDHTLRTTALKNPGKSPALYKESAESISRGFGAQVRLRYSKQHQGH